MLQGFLILIGCHLAGDIIVGVFGLSIPSSVIGMLLLFFGLIVKGAVPKSLEDTAGGLIKYIGLLFVPAGAGISAYLGLLAEEWPVILLASVSATILTLMSCGLLFQILASRGKHDAS